MAEDPTPAEVEEDPPAPELVHGAPVTWSTGQRVLHPRREDLASLVRTLRDEDGFNMCIDVTGVDYLAYEADRALPDGVEAERFEVVVSLLSHADRERIRLRVQVPEASILVASQVPSSPERIWSKLLTACQPSFVSCPLSVGFWTSTLKEAGCSS